MGVEMCMKDGERERARERKGEALRLTPSSKVSSVVVKRVVKYLV